MGRNDIAAGQLHTAQTPETALFSPDSSEKAGYVDVPPW